MNKAYYFGKVAKCQQGKIGIMYDVKKVQYRNGEPPDITYLGIGLDGSPWQSKNPTTICNSIKEYYETKI